MEQTTIHPFPGLRPFEEDEEHLFFGREKSITDLLSRLRTSRFVAVIGTSGSGKSSLIKAGLLPSLYRGFMAQAGSSWRVAVFRPGDNPIGNLARALSDNFLLHRDSDADSEDDPEQDDMRRKMMESTLRRSNRGLIELVKEARLPAHENLLIVVDQFEELFRFSRLERSHQEEKLDSTAFVNLLLESSAQTAFPVYVILTMRSDFLGDCTEFRELPEAINRGQYLIPRMTRNEKRAAISGPVAVGGAEITPTLLSRVLNDVGNNPDQLPILQHALMRTWDYRLENGKNGEPLDLVHYEAIGTMAHALSKHAEEAYRELKTPKNQTICEKMFKLLTDRGETGRGVRRPAKVSEICAVTGASEKEVIQVVNVFRRPGRTFLMPPSEVKLNLDSVIDISHESLMRIWERLIQWVKEEEQSAEMYLRLANAAALHEQGKVGLWRDPELMLALNWRQETNPNAVWAQRYDPSFQRAIDFLDAGKKQKDFEIKEKERQQKAKIKAARMVTAIFAVLFLAAVFFAVMSVKSSNEAHKERERAQKEALAAKNARDDAFIQQRKVRIENIKADAAKAYATRQEERADIQRKKAVENEIKAKKAETTAKKNESIAKDNENRAKIKGFIVNLDRQEDNFHQRLAKAKELAVYSLTQSEDKELKALLALEAYNRNSHAYKNLEESTKKIYAEFKRLNARHNLEWIPGVKDLKKKYRGLQRKSTARPPVPEMFDALRKAYIAKQGKQEDIIYPAAESWALAVTGDHSIVFNDRKGNLLLAPLQTTSGGGKIPVINKTGMVNLSLDTPMQASCFTAAADRLFCGTLNGKIVYWGTNKWREKGKELPVLHEAKILSMAYSTVKNLLVYSVKNVVYAHNLVDSAAPVLVLEQGNFIRALAVIEDHEEPVLLAADKQGNIFLSDLSARGRKKEKKILNVDPKSGAFHALAYHSAMKWLALGNSRGEVWLFPGIDGKRLKAVKSGEELPHFVFDRKHKGIVRVLRFSAGGRCLASGGWDGTIMLWKVKEKDAAETVKQDPTLTIRSQRKILSLVFASQGEYMIFSDDRHLRLCPTSPKPFRDVLLERKKRGFGARETEMYLDQTTKPPKPGPAMKGREK